MDVEDTAPPSQPLVSREKTAPFLIRAFVKIGGFHRLSLFESGTPPTTDEVQLYTWRDATLRELVTSLRNTAPTVAEYKHPLARFFFRTVYADSANRGRFAEKEIGKVYSRDILGEPGSLGNVAARLREDAEVETWEVADSENAKRTLDELRFVPGDYLLISVVLPKNVTTDTTAKAAAAPAATGANGWKNAPSAPSGPPAGRGGGGHWRGGSDAPTGPSGRGGRGRGGEDRDRDRDRDARPDRRVPPPRRGVDSPPPVRGRGWGARGGRGGRGGGDGGRRSRSRSISRSPSRSPPRRRRYD